MGSTTTLPEACKLTSDHDPDIVILAETRMRTEGRDRLHLAEALPDYKRHLTCKKAIENMRAGERTRAAGVAIAVHKRLTAHASVEKGLVNNEAVAGHCQLITLKPQGSDEIDVWAAYIYIYHMTYRRLSERREVYQLLREKRYKKADKQSRQEA